MTATGRELDRLDLGRSKAVARLNENVRGRDPNFL